jgi:hypothetical protein
LHFDDFASSLNFPQRYHLFFRAPNLSVVGVCSILLEFDQGFVLLVPVRSCFFFSCIEAITALSSLTDLCPRFFIRSSSSYLRLARLILSKCFASHSIIHSLDHEPTTRPSWSVTSISYFSRGVNVCFPVRPCV